MKKEQLALREQALLTEALNCFATERCEDVTVARIAKLAGVAKGTVYLHFKSKDEICARLSQDFYDSLARKYSEISGDGRTRLKKIVETSFNHYRALKHYRHVVQYCNRDHFIQNLNADIARSLQSIGIIRRQHISKALELGMNDRTLAGNASANLTGICCALEGALLNFRFNPDTEQFAEKEFIESVTHYILTSVGQNKSTKPVNNTSYSPALTPEV